ncbi:lactate/malate family dehydrogenase [Streptococcus sciuri]|uniref:NAD(P)-binding domain-containing protein n=1 Tax=Streptococcus sciuri TaxID=2973939 RepID=A0ABT2F4P4_9STRE|nr:NAD(P)-binding domain-containing protein [Streptococcus sciuri]MCS4487441.1 NAD(P)-binding domain-containing protein [Streptococcus sciuri]
MHKVGIIGLGNVGSTLSNNLVQSGAVDELVLIDKRKDKLLADKLDLEDSFAASGHFVTIKTNDYTELSDAELVVISVGDIKAYFGDNPDRWVELAINRKNVIEISQQLKKITFSGIIIVISNPCDAITTLLQKELNYPTDKIFGTGTLLDTSRLKRQLWQETGIAPSSLSGYVLGEHGDSQFIAWSTIDDVLLSGIERTHFEESVRKGGQAVFNGKRYTNFAIAKCCQQLIEAVFQDSHSIYPVSTYHQEFGVYISYPAIIGRKGILSTYPLSLNTEEEKKMQLSAQAILSKTSSK